MSTLNHSLITHFGYQNILNYQSTKKNCKYKLEDCYGIPECQTLVLYYTNIKTLRSLESRKFDKLVVNNINIENLKYCPQSSEFDFFDNPLLSYYGITSNNIKFFVGNLCGDQTYVRIGYTNDDIPTLEQLNDPKFNGDIFCHFPFEVTKTKYSNVIHFNPWNQIYEDPNEVENYDFLFMPFYSSSENFRNKAKEFIKNLDITSLDRSDLW